MVTPRLVTASRRLAAALPSACALLFVAPPALAQATDPQDPTNPDSAGHNVPDKPRPADEPDRTPKLEFRAKGELTFQSDLDEGGGDVQVWRAGAGAGYGFWIGEQLRLKVDLDAEHSAYQFDGATGLVPGPAGAPGPGDPFDDFVSVALIPSATFFLSRDLGLFAGGGPEYSAEAGVDLADGVNWSGFAGFRYSVNPDFAFSLGLGARTRSRDSTLWVPIIGVEWKLTDRVSFLTKGLGARVVAEVREDVSVWIGGGYELREFDLDDEGPAPGGVLSDRRAPVGVGVLWQTGENLSIELFGGVVVWQEFEVTGADEQRISETNADPAPLLRVTGRLTF